MKYHLMPGKAHLYSALIGLLLAASAVSAEERLPELKKGMTTLEVVKLWGSPLEKIEKESKRRDLWVYKSSKLLFENGSLVSIEDSAGKKALLNAEAKVLEAKQAALPASTPIANQDVVDDILSEIMKDPSNSEPADVRPGGPPPQPNVINQVPPPEVIQ